MDRVTIPIGPLAEILGRLPDLTLRDFATLKLEVARAEGLLRSRLGACADRDRERRQDLLRRHYAKGGEPLKVVPADAPADWAAPFEEEAVMQGQDGPDPAYTVAPRFGGAEMRPTPADPFEGFADMAPEAFDALAPVYAIQAGEAGLTEADRCPLTGDAPGDEPIDPAEPIPFVLADPDDDADDTPLVVPPFTDEQEGE